MKTLGFVFNSPPHSSARGREGLDAVLATSAYSEDIQVFFRGAGVMQLVQNQQPDAILTRDYISAFKLMELYDIEHVYVCEQSLKQWGIEATSLLIDVTVLTPEQLAAQLHQCRHLLTF